jgi:hypothetical protein
MNYPQTSFVNLFSSQQSVGLVVNRIEIPLIQRDYVQGRKGETVERIRFNFLNALCTAVESSGRADISLDFVYGDVENGTLFPLDGQQRLTTLFLLHWYLARRSNKLIQGQSWTNFTYATRPSARLFCERLIKVEVQLTAEVICLSKWLIDQAWYLYTWKHDPSIQSMLVMLDDIHLRFQCSSDTDCTKAWDRLTDTQQPAIKFHFLPMQANGLTDDLYIKMNSRGKPLTRFENFKANFEELLKKDHPARANSFAKQIDAEWSDMLWKYRSDDYLIDEAFMHYFRFVTEVYAWQSNILFSDETRIDDLAQQVYGNNNPDAAAHLNFLFKAFDVWHGKNIKDEFENLFTAASRGESTPLFLFNVFNNISGGGQVNLFAACCQFHGRSEWTLAHTLLLYAVLLNRIYKTNNFPRQLRILRNLIEASDLLRQNMPKLLADVKLIVIDCTLNGVTAFIQAQVDNEKEKVALLTQQPELKDTLYQLEDHELLHGCLTAFDLDLSHNHPNKLMKRANVFRELFKDSKYWPELTGAMLAIDDYSRRWLRWTGYRYAYFGASQSETSWSNLFRGKIEPDLVKVLNTLLDDVDILDIGNSLKEIQQKFVNQCTTTMEWRYYFVKYPAMRQGKSGRYTMRGYSACMLEKKRMSSKYRDPFLLAILEESGANANVLANPWPWFFGYEIEPRQMILIKSGIKIQCVDEGWKISESLTDPIQQNDFTQVCSKLGIDQNGLYSVPQNTQQIDIEDRVVLGANLLKDLVAANL